MFLTSLANSLDLAIATLLLILEYAMMLLTTGIFLSIKRISSIKIMQCEYTYGAL